MKFMKQGSRGASVRTVQERLNRNGFGPLSVDGVFGPKTDLAVEQFQLSSDLVADGIVGPRTWAALLVESRVVATDAVCDEQQRLMVLADKHCSNGGALSVLEAAISDLGAVEIPNGSNWGAEINHLVNGYNEYWGVKGDKHYPWCAMAVSSWIRIGLGCRSWESHPFEAFYGGVAQIEAWGKNRATFSAADSGDVAAGSIFTMGRGGSGSDPSKSVRAGHTGLVVCDAGDKVVTIEGNTSNGVRSLLRSKSDLRGFVRWWS